MGEGDGEGDGDTPGTGDRGRGIGDGGHGKGGIPDIEGRGQRAGDRGPETGDRRQGTGDRGQEIEDKRRREMRRPRRVNQSKNIRIIKQQTQATQCQRRISCNLMKPPLHQKPNPSRNMRRFLRTR